MESQIVIPLRHPSTSSPHHRKKFKRKEKMGSDAKANTFTVITNTNRSYNRSK
jgi:hypothetical protein